MADKFLEQLDENQGFDGVWVYGVQYGQDVKIRGSSIGGGGVSGQVQPRLVYAGPVTGSPTTPTFRMLTASDIPDLSGLYITATGAELTAPKINNPVIVGGSLSGVTAVFDDNKLTVRNVSDTTKQIGFDLSGIAAGNKRTLSFDDGNYTIVGTTVSQTLTNKRLFLVGSEPAGASFRLSVGQAPAVPQTGDVWMQADGMYYRISGSTIGPLAAGGGGGGGGVTSFNTRVGAVTLDATDVNTALGYTPLSPTADRVSRFNNRMGNVTLTSSDVINALGYTPAASGGGGSGVSSFNTRTGAVTLTSGDVTGALGFTPFSSAGGTVSGSVTAAGLSVAGNAVWHAGNFTPSTKATLGSTVNFSTVNASTLAVSSGYISNEASTLVINVSGARFVYEPSGRFTAVNGGIGCNGDMGVNGSITATADITAYSDLRLKRDVSTVEDALELVDNMRGVWYTMGDKDRVGVIAQEIEQVLPQVVVTGDDGYKSVAYGNIVGVLIEAIKELKREVDRLKEK